MIHLPFFTSFMYAHIRGSNLYISFTGSCGALITTVTFMLSCVTSSLPYLLI